ncbi:hypothetical protein D9M70_652920 [compost metagenome]
MKRFQAKHFLDPEPADDLGFHKHYPEKQTGNQVFEVMIPFMLQLAFIKAGGVYCPDIIGLIIQFNVV